MDEIDTGVDFNFSYASGVSEEQIIGFEMAGQIWSSYLKDDVAVNIYVEATSDLPENVIGGALPGTKKNIKYDKVRQELEADIISANDSLAFDNLPSSDKEFSVIHDDVALEKTKEFKLTNANAKALSLSKSDDDKLDGYILVSDLTGQDNVSWGYDPLRDSNLGGNELDFLSVAMHEIGHILGFVSGVDDDGWLEVITESQEKDKELKDNAFKFATTLDLFRYSDKDSAQGQIDISMGGNPFFSLDGGSTSLGNFATGAYTDLGGDGYQASHWKNGSNLGIMNPVLSAGNRNSVSNIDLTAMDAIGWDVDDSGELDWQAMFDAAVANAETAVFSDRSKDVEKMVKDSQQFEGRRFPRGRAWQIGFWQYTTLPNADVSEIDPIPESVSVPETFFEDGDNSNSSSEAEEQLDNESNNLFSDDNSAASANDNLALGQEQTYDGEDAVVSQDENGQDSLLSGGLIGEQLVGTDNLDDSLV